MNQELFQSVMGVLAVLLSVSEEEINPDASFKADFAVDSLGMIELKMQLEELLGIEISDEAVGDITTVNDLLDVIISAQSCVNASAACKSVSPHLTNSPG